LKQTTVAAENSRFLEPGTARRAERQLLKCGYGIAALRKTNMHFAAYVAPETTVNNRLKLKIASPRFRQPDKT
jgi:hypothetical protein